jgi:nucleoside-diphosphate-sugar epimerase
MGTSRKAHPLLELGVRIIADTVMINVSLAAAMLARYIVETWAEGGVASRGILIQYVEGYLQNFWILTIIALSVFSMSGFYTRGRYYQGKYKVLIVAQAVSFSYLIFGCVAWLTQAPISILPRSVLFIGWLLTSGLLILARFWSMLWRMLEGGEASKYRPDVQKPVARRALVIGGAGYIGSALLPKLLARGYHVRLLDLFLFGQEPIASVLGHPNLEIVHADFRHMDKIVHAMKGMDEVIHLGGIVGDPACSLDQELTVEVNLMATRMIAEAAKGSGIRRFCFASTCSVYGANDQLLDERSDLNPISLYARSKLASETVLMELADAFFSPVILRFGTVYGLSGRTRFDLVVNLLTAKAVVDGKITVSGGGQWRPLLHVDDAALALMKAVEAPTELVHGEVFNVGSNEQNYRLEEAAQVIQSLVTEAEIEKMEADTDFRSYRVDFTKITKILGFIPQWTLQEGIKQVIAALENGEVKDYRHPMYSNVKFLSEESNSHLIRPENGWAYKLINEEIKSRTAPAVSIISQRDVGSLPVREKGKRRGDLKYGRTDLKVN